jgi:hypothetical protein
VFLHSLLRWASRTQVLAVCAVLSVGFLLFFGATERQAPGGTPGMLDLQIAFSRARFDEIVARWNDVGVLEIQTRNLWIDLLFPLAYSFLLSGLLGALTLPSGARPGRGLTLLLALPFLAGLLDWLENGLQIVVLGQGSGRSSCLILLSSTAATMKWALLTVCGLAVLSALVRRSFRPAP